MSCCSIGGAGRTSGRRPPAPARPTVGFSWSVFPCSISPTGSRAGVCRESFILIGAGCPGKSTYLRVPTVASSFWWMSSIAVETSRSKKPLPQVICRAVAGKRPASRPRGFCGRNPINIPVCHQCRWPGPRADDVVDLVAPKILKTEPVLLASPVHPADVLQRYGALHRLVEQELVVAFGHYLHLRALARPRRANQSKKYAARTLLTVPNSDCPMAWSPCGCARLLSGAGSPAP